MERVGLVVNFRKSQGKKLLKSLTEWFKQREILVVLPEFQVQDAVAACPDIRFKEAVDLIITLGGDGTLLSCARSLAGSGILILGVNLGHLGFLTDLELPDLFPYLDKLLAGEFSIEERMMLAAEVWRQGSLAASFTGLNDVVLSKGPLSRIVMLETHVDNEYLSTYRADGIIVSSPTGSTAYSLSAGGPIVDPGLGVILVTPICPHTLYARPFVLDDRQTVRIVLKSDYPDIMVTIDGQVGFYLKQGDQIVVGKSPFTTRLVKLRNRPFFEVLRVKLREGER